MANNEKSFQTELLQQMRLAKYHVFKVTTPFMTGVPDLYVKAPGMPACWIELKYEIWDLTAVRRSGIPLNLSPLQRKFIGDELKVGGRAGWAVCMRNSTAWDLFAGTAIHLNCIPVPSPDYYIQSRAPGQLWNIQKLMETIIG